MKIAALAFLIAVHAFLPPVAAAYLVKDRTPVPDECTAIAACSPPGHDRVLNGEQLCINPYNKKKVRHAFWKKDKLEGNFACWDDEGVPVLEAHFRAGKLDGEVRRYLLIGAAGKSRPDWSRQAYRKGKREGLFIVPLGEGRFSVSFFHEDRRQGFELRVAASGEVEAFSDCMIHGEPAPSQECAGVAIPGYKAALARALEKSRQDQQAAGSRQVTELFANGEVRRRYGFVDGKIEGAYEEFYANGQAKLIEHFRNGKRHGSSSRYASNGVLLLQVDYNDGEIRDFARFYRDGAQRLTWAREAGDDSLIHYRDYYENGVLREEGARRVAGDFAAGEILEAGIAHGAVTSWRPDGSLLSSRHYEEGKRVGLWQQFADTVVLEEEYAEDRIRARRLRERASGAVLREIEYTPDGVVALDRNFPGYTPELERYLYPQ
ncbi:MAG: hypothetical protein FWD77_10050 [Betaproteobacteria bacterium]|nr:hypothetical protein [Betaproteobacteria bacterium]